ncbi:DBH-like monooxygenase protein 1 homolog isoform X2 [Corticium candelabrum]|uniref:DBH-like monooxygenase protein 1 homolog isoform X2 n=1 Tax=Corticium candelabrum TaxID=121492 RepID=UPI002E276DDE|nr:DBH-like monooxygenase protein 1 homolog isoform X2 [Corticium candelabrum]
MIWPVLAFSVLAAITVVQCNQGCPSGYSRGQYLDASTQKYLLCWKVDWSDMSITFLAKVATAGWIGLGFSPTGFMPNSDVVIGWVKDGQGYLKDRFAAERAQPAIDKIQNVKLLSFSEADGMTTLEFKRDLDACEPRDRSIEFAPVVQAGHEELVHHILIYKCHDGVDSYLTMSWDCDNPPNFIPESIQECRESAQIAAWAVGGAGVTFPSHVGLPMSGQTGAQYVMMETHYNNEKSGADYVDSSGIRIYYTPTKRQYDGAVLQFGHAFGQGYNLFLPPRKDNILTETLCPAACTRASFPSKGVNVFGTMLHSHTVGKGIWIEHSRNGVQLPNIDSNYNYDFNFQDVVLLSNEVKILPGDDVQVFCDYDTTSRQHVTLGGEGATDEMCLAFLLVYPRPSLACCVSQIPTQTFIYYIIQAELKGYYVDVTNKSADDRTRFNQRIQALHNMKFGSDDEYTLWDQQYWSARQREVICRDQSHNNLVILDGQSAQYYDLPTIKRVLTDAPTFGTPKPCESIVEAPRPPTGSALDSICDSLWIAFSSFVAITMDY